MANIKHIDVGSELSKAEWEAANSHQVTQTIADNDIVTVDGSPADNEYAKFTANGVEGRSYSELRTDINVEDGADVTDATNVAAAGAVMEADTSTASMSFVVDEDDMVSDDDTKVPTQQSVKAYVDAHNATVDPAYRIRVANSAPSTPNEGDVYIDSVENAFFIATD